MFNYSALFTTIILSNYQTSVSINYLDNKGFILYEDGTWLGNWIYKNTPIVMK